MSSAALTAAAAAARTPAAGTTAVPAVPLAAAVPAEQPARHRWVKIALIVVAIVLVFLLVIYLLFHTKCPRTGQTTNLLCAIVHVIDDGVNAVRAVAQNIWGILVAIGLAIAGFFGLRRGGGNDNPSGTGDGGDGGDAGGDGDGGDTGDDGGDGDGGDGGGDVPEPPDEAVHSRVRRAQARRPLAAVRAFPPPPPPPPNPGPFRFSP